MILLREIKNIFFKYLFSQFLNFEKNKKLSLIAEFKGVGKNFKLGNNYMIKNPQYIEIGDHFFTRDRFRIEALDCYLDQKFKPQIKIGNNVFFNTDIHIGCIDRIEIGHNCLFASRIYITDHHHGHPTADMLKLAPRLRPLTSKGPVIIKDNVWIGEGVAIMPGVTIGENCIIATNAVVTKDVPANCVVAGVPAKIIKIMK
jgi:acetyltransferase-like isoleucine patch superfamily enzyme